METDREARIRQRRAAARAYDKALEDERAERRARAVQANAIWKNICAEHPELRARPSTATSTRSATVDRKVGSAPWAVREIHSDGRCEWYKADGSETAARSLADRVRKTSEGKVEAMQMGGAKSRSVTR